MSDEVNVFETASRKKVRFDTHMGQLTVEDLWDLPLTSKTGRLNLDDMAREFHGRMEATAATSFVETSTNTDEAAELGFTLVKHVIDVKIIENKANKDAKAKADERKKLLGILSNKKDEELEGLSVEEIEERLKAL